MNLEISPFWKFRSI